MRRILGLLLLVTVTMVVTSCLKDSEKFIPYETYIDSSILGVIGDQDNLPVENATVVYEGEDANTNPDGIFIFSDVVVPNSGARLLVQKVGFFDAYRSIDPHADNRSLDVRLKSFGPEYVFLATSGKELTEPSGAGISIGSGVFELPSGDIYTGQVSSHFGILDALDPDVSGAFAATEKGIDSNGQSKLLEHYGTMWTSFQSTSNTDLIIRDGAFITLRFPKPSGTNAPASLTLWKLDESEGYWVEYGIAQLTGDHYEAQVHETGTWSIQRAFDFATLTGRVKNTKGLDLERARIALSRENSDIIRRVWTDSEGRFEIDYPIREELHISIEDECQTSLYDAVEGPFLGNYELNTTEVETGDTYWRVTGIVTQCNNPTKGIDDGYSFIQTSRYKWITPVEQGGGFSSGMFLCGNNFNVSGHDVVNEKESGRSVVTPEVSCGESCFSVGALIACN